MNWWFWKRNRNASSGDAQQGSTSNISTVTVNSSEDERRVGDGQENGVTTTPVDEKAAAEERKPYKQRVPLHVRRQQVAVLNEKFPGKIPIVVERFKKEKTLPPLDKTKFLVPYEVTASQFVIIIKSRLNLGGNEPMYLLVNNRALACTSITAYELYSDFRDEDGFLYITYASQEIFGNCCMMSLQRFYELICCCSCCVQEEE